MKNDDREEIVRCPVTKEWVLAIFLKCFGDGIQNQEMQGYLKTFIEFYISNPIADRKKKTVTGQARFVAIFEELYKSKYGVDYVANSSPKVWKMIGFLTKRLDEKNYDYIRYCKWFFDVWLESGKNDRHKGSIVPATWNDVFNQYVLYEPDERVDRYIDSERRVLLKRMSDVIRITGDKEVIKLKKELSLKVIEVETARRTLARKLVKLRKKGVNLDG